MAQQVLNYIDLMLIVVDLFFVIYSGAYIRFWGCKTTKVKVILLPSFSVTDQTETLRGFSRLAKNTILGKLLNPCAALL